MQIHELDTYIGTPSDSDYLAVDDGTETFKIPMTSVGVTDEMTVAEAEEGSETAPRVISPAVLNTYVSNATEMADRVIEEGTSGIWIYRKWSSGTAECWARIEANNVSYSAQRFGANAYMGELTGAFPFSLGTNPKVVANGVAFAGSYGFLMQSFCNDGTNFTVRLIREGSATAGTTIVNLYAIGTWE